MNTIILDEPGQFRFTQTELPQAPAVGEALVQVKRVGICGTDLHAYRGRQPFFSYPRILGHELGVEVLALGPGSADSGIKVGMLCAVEPYLNCGECSPCRQGRTNCCERLQVLGVHADGGMREQIIVPIDKLHPSASLSVEELALVEMLCIGAHAVRRAKLGPGERVLVIGAGPIGLSTIQFAQIAGADVAVLELNEQRRDFCQRHLGIEQITGGAEGEGAEIVDAVRSLFDGDLPATVFDATGNVHSMKGAFQYVDSGGTLVFVGLVQDEISFYDPEFHRKEMTVLSSRNATAEDFAFAIEMLEAGRINLKPWITHHASPESIVEQFPRWLEPQTGVVKAMLDF